MSELLARLILAPKISGPVFADTMTQGFVKFSPEQRERFLAFVVKLKEIGLITPESLSVASEKLAASWYTLPEEKSIELLEYAEEALKNWESPPSAIQETIQKIKEILLKLHKEILSKLHDEKMSETGVIKIEAPEEGIQEPSSRSEMRPTRWRKVGPEMVAEAKEVLGWKSVRGKIAFLYKHFHDFAWDIPVSQLPEAQKEYDIWSQRVQMALPRVLGEEGAKPFLKGLDRQQKISEIKSLCRWFSSALKIFEKKGSIPRSKEILEKIQALFASHELISYSGLTKSQKAKLLKVLTVLISQEEDVREQEAIEAFNLFRNKKPTPKSVRAFLEWAHLLSDNPRIQNVPSFSYFHGMTEGDFFTREKFEKNQKQMKNAIDWLERTSLRRDPRVLSVLEGFYGAKINVEQPNFVNELETILSKLDQGDSSKDVVTHPIAAMISSIQSSFQNGADLPGSKETRDQFLNTLKRWAHVIKVERTFGGTGTEADQDEFISSFSQAVVLAAKGILTKRENELQRLNGRLKVWKAVTAKLKTDKQKLKDLQAQKVPGASGGEDEETLRHEIGRDEKYLKDHPNVQKEQLRFDGATLITDVEVDFFRPSRKHEDFITRTKQLMKETRMSFLAAVIQEKEIYYSESFALFSNGTRMREDAAKLEQKAKSLPEAEAEKLRNEAAVLREKAEKGPLHTAEGLVDTGDIFLELFMNAMHLMEQGPPQKEVSQADLEKPKEELKSSPKKGSRILIVRENVTDDQIEEVRRSAEEEGEPIEVIMTTVGNGATHWVQMARGRPNAPMIMIFSEKRIEKMLNGLKEGQDAVALAQEGILAVNPTPERLTQMLAEQKTEQLLKETEAEVVAMPSHVSELETIDTLRPVGQAEKSHSRGVGLARSDILTRKMKASLRALSVAMVQGRFNFEEWKNTLQNTKFTKAANIENFQQTWDGPLSDQAEPLSEEMSDKYGTMIRDPSHRGKDLSVRMFDAAWDEKTRDLLEAIRSAQIESTIEQMVEQTHAKSPSSDKQNLREKIGELAKKHIRPDQTFQVDTFIEESLEQYPAIEKEKIRKGGLIKDLSKPIYGFNFYQNTAIGEFLLFWQWKTFLIEQMKAGESAGQASQAILEILFPMIESPEQLDYLQNDALPKVIKLAAWDSVVLPERNPVTLGEAERRIREIAEKVLFGAMIERKNLLGTLENPPQDPQEKDKWLEGLRTRRKIIEHPFLSFFNFGGTDLAQQFWSSELNAEIRRDDPEAGYYFTRSHPALLAGENAFMQDLIEYNKTRPKGLLKFVRICGIASGKEWNALAVEKWSRMGVPVSVSVAPEDVPHTHQILVRAASVGDEDLDRVFGNWDPQDRDMETRLEKFSKKWFGPSGEFLKEIGNINDNYREAGLYSEFHGPVIYPLKGLKSIAGFDHLKTLALILSKAAHGSRRQTVLSGPLNLSEHETMTSEDLRAVLDALEGTLVLHPEEKSGEGSAGTSGQVMGQEEKAEREQLEDAFEFFTDVETLYKEKQKEDPEKYKDSLNPENFDDFLDAFEGRFSKYDFLSRLRDPRTPEPEEYQTRRDQFYNEYYNYADALLDMIMRLGHVVGAEFYPPRNIPLGKAAEIQPGTPAEAIELQNWERLGWVFGREKGLGVEQRTEINVFTLPTLRHASKANPKFLKMPIVEILKQHSELSTEVLTKVLSKPLFRSMTLGEVLASETTNFQLLKYTLQAHPDLIFKIFHPTIRSESRVQTGVSFSVQRAIEEVFGQRTLTENMPSITKEWKREFDAQLEANGNTTYMISRFNYRHFLDRLFSRWRGMKNMFTDGEQYSAIHMQTLQTYEFMENLQDAKDYVVSLAGSVYRRIRSEPQKIKALRLAVLVDGMIRPQFRQIAGYPTEPAVAEAVREALQGHDFSEDLLKQIIWLCYNHILVSDHELITSEEVLDAMSIALRHLNKEWPRDSEKHAAMLDMLYVMIFTSRIGLTEPNKILLRMRGGANQSLATWDTFYLTASFLLDNKKLFNPQGYAYGMNKKEIGKIMTDVLSKQRENVVLAGLGGERGIDLSKEIPMLFDKQAVEKILGEYLEQTAIGENPGTKQQLYKLFAEGNDADWKASIREAYGFYEKTVGAYSVKVLLSGSDKSSQEAAIIRQMIFFNHIHILSGNAEGQEDVRTVPIAFSRIPGQARKKNILFEILVGIGKDEPALAYVWSAVLFLNGFFIEKVSSWRLEDAKGVALRYLGAVPGKEKNIEDVKKQIREDMDFVFGKVGWRSLKHGKKQDRQRRKEELFKHLDELVAKRLGGSIIVAKRPGSYAQATKAEFIPFPSVYGQPKHVPSVLKISTPDRWGLFVVVTGIFSRLYDFNIADLRFDDLKGGMPRLLIYLTDKNGNPLSGAIQREIERKLTAWLEQKVIVMKKGKIIKEGKSVRAELRVEAEKLFLSGSVAIGMQIGILRGGLTRRFHIRGQHRSEVRQEDFQERMQSPSGIPAFLTSRVYPIEGKLGIPASSAAEMVKVVNRHSSIAQVIMNFSGKRINMRSIIEFLKAEIPSGANVVIEIEPKPAVKSEEIMDFWRKLERAGMGVLSAKNENSELWAMDENDFLKDAVMGSTFLGGYVARFMFSLRRSEMRVKTYGKQSLLDHPEYGAVIRKMIDDFFLNLPRLDFQREKGLKKLADQINTAFFNGILENNYRQVTSSEIKQSHAISQLKASLLKIATISNEKVWGEDGYGKIREMDWKHWVIHDLNNFIMVFLGFLEFFKKQGDLEDLKIALQAWEEIDILLSFHEAIGKSIQSESGSFFERIAPIKAGMGDSKGSYLQRTQMLNYFGRKIFVDSPFAKQNKRRFVRAINQIEPLHYKIKGYVQKIRKEYEEIHGPIILEKIVWRREIEEYIQKIKEHEKTHGILEKTTLESDGKPTEEKLPVSDISKDKKASRSEARQIEDRLRVASLLEDTINNKTTALQPETIKITSREGIKKSIANLLDLFQVSEMTVAGMPFVNDIIEKFKNEISELEQWKKRLGDREFLLQDEHREAIALLAQRIVLKNNNEIMPWLKNETPVINQETIAVARQSQIIKRILVADDEAGIRSVLEIILRRMGYTVIPAENGQKAFELLKKDNFDFLITDFKMPGLNGGQLLKAMANGDLSQKIPAILMTGNVEDVDFSELKKGLDVELVVKPHIMNPILAVLKKYGGPDQTRSASSEGAAATEGKTADHSATQELSQKGRSEVRQKGLLQAEPLSKAQVKNVEIIQYIQTLDSQANLNDQIHETHPFVQLFVYWKQLQDNPTLTAEMIKTYHDLTQRYGYDLEDLLKSPDKWSDIFNNTSMAVSVFFDVWENPARRSVVASVAEEMKGLHKFHEEVVTAGRSMLLLWHLRQLVSDPNEAVKVREAFQSVGRSETRQIEDRLRVVKLLQHILNQGNTLMALLYAENAALVSEKELTKAVRETLAAFRIFDIKQFEARGGELYIPKGNEYTFGYSISSVRDFKTYQTPVFKMMERKQTYKGESLRQLAGNLHFEEINGIFSETVTELERLRDELLKQEELLQPGKLNPGLRSRAMVLGQKIREKMQQLYTKLEVETTAVTAVPTMGSKRVLIVDGEDLVQKVLTSQLRSLDYVASAVSDGPEVWRKLQEDDFDLVIIDTTTPGMDGIRLAQTMFEKGKNIRVIFLRDYDDESVAVEKFEKEGRRVAFLTKPFKVEDLQKVITRISGRSEIRTEELTRKVALRLGITDDPAGHKIFKISLEEFAKRKHLFAETHPDDAKSIHAIGETYETLMRWYRDRANQTEIEDYIMKEASLDGKEAETANRLNALHKRVTGASPKTKKEKYWFLFKWAVMKKLNREYQARVEKNTKAMNLFGYASLQDLSLAEIPWIPLTWSPKGLYIDKSLIQLLLNDKEVQLPSGYYKSRKISLKDLGAMEEPLEIRETTNLIPSPAPSAAKPATSAEPKLAQSELPLFRSEIRVIPTNAFKTSLKNTRSSVRELSIESETREVIDWVAERSGGVYLPEEITSLAPQCTPEQIRAWIAIRLLGAFEAARSAKGKIDNPALQKVIESFLERYRITGAKDPTMESREVHVAFPVLSQSALKELAGLSPFFQARAVVFNVRLYLNVQGDPKSAANFKKMCLDAARRNGITVADGQFRVFGVSGSEGNLFKSLNEPGAREDVLLAGEEKALPENNRATLWYNSPKAQEDMKSLASEISEALHAAIDSKVSKGSRRNISEYYKELTVAIANAIQASLKILVSA
ncbi:MAG: response regulator [Candidatus Omnitrophota bacterium]